MNDFHYQYAEVADRNSQQGYEQGLQNDDQLLSEFAAEFKAITGEWPLSGPVHDGFGNYTAFGLQYGMLTLKSINGQFVAIEDGAAQGAF